MIYLWPQTTSIEKRLHSGFGVLTRPADETIVKGIREKRLWACDNGVFSGKFEAEEFFRFLRRLLPFLARCLFVVAPDVYGDARGTLALFPAYAWRIQSMGYPVAYVAQDGAEGLPFPSCDWLFIGGTTDWKLSPAAGSCILRAKRAGLRVHVGRVNSLYRIGVFEAWGRIPVMGRIQFITRKRQPGGLVDRSNTRCRSPYAWLIGLYLLSIAAANLSITFLGPRVAVLNAFLFIGLDLTCRDRLHDAWEHKNLVRNMFLLILAGSLLSWIFSAGRVAVVSFLAFAAGAGLDGLAYALLKQRVYLLRVNGSNLVGALGDSFVFALGLGATGLTVPIFAAKVLGGFLWSILLRV